MAIFLARAFNFPAASHDYFTDDNGKVYEEAANRLFESGLTVGCGPSAYCGDSFIRRDQMAAMFARALGLPASSTNHYNDDNGSAFEDAINKIADAGITQGCNPPSNSAYCPGQNVTRGQMSAFIKRAVEYSGPSAPGAPGAPGGPASPIPVISGGLPNAVVEVPYSAQLPITGGLAPYTVTKLSGPVWAGVSSSGLVTGTPLSGNLGSAHLEVRVRDSRGSSITAAIVLTVVDKCQGVTAVPAAQCNALKALYNNTGGNNWTDRTNWFTNPNPCTWYGIGCNGTNITLIRLNENNLSGTLPIELGALTGLQEINLQDNLLSGPIPAELFGITTLRIVILAHNGLGGEIPEFTVPLPSLTRLALDSNGIGGPLPTSMNGTNLPAIVELALDENGLTGDIPVEFFTMHTLTNVRLDENQLTGQTNGFTAGNFPSLTRLELGNNEFDAQPFYAAELATLTGLTVLDLSGNQFTGPIPTEFTALGALSRLELDSNALEGPIPAGFNATSFPNIAAVPGALTLFGQTGCLTATPASAELAFVQARDPLWNDGCP
jgi:hypothetical protein